MKQLIITKKKTASYLASSSYTNNITPLIFLNINIIKGCISKCQTCYFWKDPIVQMSANDFLKIIKKVSPFLSATKKVHLNLGGNGEPLMNEQIFEILEISKKYGFHTSLISNSMLLTKKKIEKLIESGISHIRLSLESCNSTINDEIRGIKGHFKMVDNALKLLNKQRKINNVACKFGVLTTINAKNLFSLPNLIRWVNKNKAVSNIHFQAITQVFGSKKKKNWYLDKKYSALWPSDKKLIQKIFKQIINLKKKNSKIENSITSLDIQRNYFLNPNTQNYPNYNCDMYKGLHIDPIGNAMLCPIDVQNINFKNKLLFSIKDNSINKNLNVRLLNQQQRIKTCRIQNCHVMLNCDLTNKKLIEK